MGNSDSKKRPTKPKTANSNNDSYEYYEQNSEDDLKVQSGGRSEAIIQKSGLGLSQNPINQSRNPNQGKTSN
jgi:hypothetical protein